MEYFADSPDGRLRVRGPWMLVSLAAIAVLTIVFASLTVSLTLPGGLRAILFPAERPPVYGYEIVAEYPHDPQAFTQGLVIADGEMYESTGLFGESTLRRVDLATGEVLAKADLPDDEFGEGITVIGDRIYMLTWRSRKGYVFDRESLRVVDTFNYVGEGWGITNFPIGGSLAGGPKNQQLIVSNGGSKLHFYDPTTLEPVTESRLGRETNKTVRVRSERFRTFEGINELEYIGGRVWANVLGRDSILQISPKTGRVLGFVDLSGLFPKTQRPERNAVLNGIAYDHVQNKIYVTGKKWPKIYEIRIVEK